MKINSLIVLSIAVALLTTTSRSYGIAMLDTTNWNATDSTNPYVVEGANWDAVGFIQWTSSQGDFVGTGTLVPSATAGEFKFLTAAHNVDSEGGSGSGNAPDGTIDAPNFTIYFGDDTSDDGSTADASVSVPASNIAVQPLWTNGNSSLGPGASQFDFAVMTFSASDILTGTLPAPLNLSFANPQDQTGTMVGYGTWGNGDSFTNENPDGIRRAGTNVIDIVGDPADNPPDTGFTIQSDFDGPNGQGHTTGMSMALALEASTGGGDSGGPLLVGGDIVGVLNGGFPGTGGNLSEYGDRSIWAWAGETSNRQFLTGAGISVVPEPSSFLLAVAVGFSFVLQRKRRS